AGAGVVASSAATTTSRIRLGDLVSVKGRVSDFRGVRQIAVDVVERVKDVNYEFAWHLHVIHMHNTIYAAAANPLPAHLAPDLLLAKAAEADAAEYASDALLDVTVESLDSRKLKLQSAIHKYNSLERRDIPSLAFVIKAYIEYHQFTTVEFDMVVGDPILSSLSESFLKQSSRNPNASISSIQLRLLFAKLFAVLVKEGFMFKSMTGNTQEDSYQLIRHDLNLGDAVFNAIVKCSGGKSSNGCWKEFADTGVPHDMIGLVVREKTDYRNVSNSQIQRSLKILQTQKNSVFHLPLTKASTLSPASPNPNKSSLSSLLANASPKPSSITTKSILASDAESTLPVGAEDEPVESCGGTEEDPTISFRIRNYSAVEDVGLEDTEEEGAVNGTAPISIAATSSQPIIAKSLHKSSVPPKPHDKVGVDDFERLKVIGQGGYGKVFLVRKKATQTIYAMKVLKKATLVIHTKTVEHTKNERSILSQLAHPFIVKLHYAFQTPEKLYLILQYAPGGELFSHLATQRMFDEDTASFYIGELLLALEHLHGLGIIYRDLKPENVLLDAKGHVLLTDFGLSKVALETRTVCGTIEFTAPEVLDNQIEYGAGVDHWSLGVMLYDMLTGRPPFSGNNRKKVMEAILKSKVTFPPYLTSYAKDLLTKLLRKQPAQRLGCNGAQEIKNHSYFRKLNWRQLAARELEPPIAPEVVGSLDTRNFDECFTGMSIESPPNLHPRGLSNRAGSPLNLEAAGTPGGHAGANGLLAPPGLGPSVGSSGANTGTSTPTPTNKKKKHRKKAEAVAAKYAASVAAAAAASSSASNSPVSVKATMPPLETVDSDISLEINDVPTPLTSIAIPGATGRDSASESGSLPNGHHFHGFSYVADDGFFGFDG
ncbi:serine/threonine protein kinase psk1, partial [Rhizoclosmatium sp. JEL0117]